GGVGTVLLNRPQALNAFTLGMYRRLDPMLRQWADDPDVRAVLVEGAGDRAFCAGGDVRAVYEAGKGIAGPRDFTCVFFAEEYRILSRIHRYPKPYIAIIDGITMGGGAGVSVNGAYRVATEKTMFAMPETGIGLFPDVGATRFLNLCPGHIGRYLGLTGARLGAADALYCGLATHFVPRERVAELRAALAGLAWRTGEERAQVEALLARFNADPGPAPLRLRRALIERCFAGETVETILDMLANETAEPDWASETRAALLTRSPTSLRITLRQLIVGRGLGLEDALKLEYRMTQHCMAAHDFYEGVRAALIDKDQTPHWHPPTLPEIDEATVEAYLAPLGDGELTFD
ncbi:MAG: enoyl-CoA hydratase/isomerase family protein, partial [Alphaproteobacteria bacterium]|nr:enoyl-CoA hydratase/isomerase family protein [Alphaproteobacteria bacterium]